MRLRRLIVSSFFALQVALAVRAFAGDEDCGINLPPRQGSSNAGAFLPGIYTLDYSAADLVRVRQAGFRALRIPVNAATANNTPAMEKIAWLFHMSNDRGIICFFGTKKEKEGSHGDGRPDDLELAGQCWAKIQARFKDIPGVHYEIFNEPFGYERTPEGARKYVSDMKRIIARGGLPASRCILDGMGYAEDVHSVAQAGWEGALGYHFYPNWLPAGPRTAEQYSNRIQGDLRGLSERVYITEFGASLLKISERETNQTNQAPVSRDMEALKGLQDALRAFHDEGRGVRSLYFWHGWDNGDTYDFFAKDNQAGAKLVREIQNGQGLPLNQ